MTPNALKKLYRELTAFISDMTDGMGRPERRAAMGHYITGLLLDGERKSVQRRAGSGRSAARSASKRSAHRALSFATMTSTNAT